MNIDQGNTRGRFQNRGALRPGGLGIGHHLGASQAAHPNPTQAQP
nr:hypothetical protein [Xylella taiwanensis]